MRLGLIYRCNPFDLMRRPTADILDLRARTEAVLEEMRAEEDDDE